ncbi:DNA polymerase theta (helicase domain only) [Trypanosoma brucei equiperdum]|uniref:DNA polymerase theta (Helicase domain only) n=1 Tax=Trypanosoma brucei equiperdum TaxID=630700 RepID=A0A3L6L2K3_9TRYP|nr:DNA polymerase theta (helicase domain only) [Trypanosoma brucei equiperdum]
MRKTVVRLKTFNPPQQLQGGNSSSVQLTRTNANIITGNDNDKSRASSRAVTSVPERTLHSAAAPALQRVKRGREELPQNNSASGLSGVGAVIIPSSQFSEVGPWSQFMRKGAADLTAHPHAVPTSTEGDAPPRDFCDGDEDDMPPVSQEELQREAEEDMRLSTDVILTPGTPNGNTCEPFSSVSAVPTCTLTVPSLNSEVSQISTGLDYGNVYGHVPFGTPVINDNVPSGPSASALPRPSVDDPDFFYDLPVSVKDFYATRRGIKKLYNWQHEVLMRDDIRAGGSLVYSLPTSGGKTLVAEISLLRCLINRGQSCLFVLPFVSLAEEKTDAMIPLGDVLGFTVDGHYSTRGRFPLPVSKAVFVCTIEKANSLVNHMLEENTIGRIGTIVVDELHMLGETSRGATLELLLTKLLCLRHKVQIIGMSATIPNLPDIARWLRASCYIGNYRPVPLRQYAVVGGEVLEDGREVCRSLVAAGHTSENSQLVFLTTEVKGASVLVFCASRQQTVSTARLIARSRKEEIDKEGGVRYNAPSLALVADLRALDSEESSLLSQLVPYGVAFHHGGLVAEERTLIETAFRRRSIGVLCCTSTLAAGVNLPARRVIFKTPFVAVDFLTKSRYLQMCGRAGRAGLDEFGESFLFLSRKDRNRGCELMQQEVEACVSQLLEEKSTVERALLEFVAIGLIRSLSDARKWGENILFHHAPGPIDKGLNAGSVAVPEMLEGIIQSALSKLVERGLMQRLSRPAADASRADSDVLGDSDVTNAKNGDAKNNGTGDGDAILSSSPFGSCSVRSCFGVEDALIVRLELEKLQQSGLILADDLHMCYFVTPLRDPIDVDWSIYRDILSQLNETRQRIASMIGVDEFYVNQRAMGLGDAGGNGGGRAFATRRFYAALALADLLNEVPIGEVEQRYRCNRGQLQNLLRSASMFSSSITSFCRAMEWYSLEAVLASFVKRLGFGVKPDIIPLMEIKGVQPGRARALWRAGFKDPAAVAACTPAELLKRMKEANPPDSKVVKYFSIRSAVVVLREANAWVQQNIREKKGDLADITLQSSAY